MSQKTYQADHLSSDEMEEVLKLSREEYAFINRRDPNYPVAAGSKAASSTPASTRSLDIESQSHKINDRIAEIDRDISQCDQKIEELQTKRAVWASERDQLLGKLRQLPLTIPAQSLTRSSSLTVNRKGTGRETENSINYQLESFEWSQELVTTMKRVFKIDDFRLCQRGVCNANMDARDIICVMPTGGGKSLTYQLPALLTPGCTLVISPLVSLITDQVLHLQEAGVEAIMLTGATSQAVQKAALSRFSAAVSGTRNLKEIKLCYVTPEKIAKNIDVTKMFENLARAGKLARIVIDEAHCVSEQGHDFRPDYGRLSALRLLFPKVPIMALSATCPKSVLCDLISILGLKEIVDGSSAVTNGTVYFSAPLYRKNLHYLVLPKPSATIKAYQMMVMYILTHHALDTGIVYCLSRKDAENVAQGLKKESEGRIKTGVYHADVGDKKKEDLHTKWRHGSIKVVCATTAFGLGIDKADVRFVLHHSLPKSIDGFYQESGRAGRDGKDAHCILYYRPQDAFRLGSMVSGERDGQEKLHDMLRFAQDMLQCRNVLFARYFSTKTSPESQISTLPWTTDGTNAFTPCGHCDNCTRQPGNVEHLDVTIDAWRILKIADTIAHLGGKIALIRLTELVRGKGGTSIEVAGHQKKSWAKETCDVDVKVLTDGKVTLSREDTETLLIHLLTSKYLKEDFISTPYAITTYIIPGSDAHKLSQLTREQVEKGNGPRVMCSFRRQPRKMKTRAKRGLKTQDSTKQGHPRKQVEASEDDGDDEGLEADSGGEGGNSDTYEDTKPQASSSILTKRTQADRQPDMDSDADDDFDDDWSYSMRAGTSNHKKPRVTREQPSTKTVREGDIEFMVLSSD